ncbi:MAG TPA: N-formylglutamate amidohydrolase [Alphaproteobacteria bacterium]
MSASSTAESRLLAPDDPPPVEIFNDGGASPLLVVCDHAGRRLPQRLGNLGLDAASFDRHIAWDIGAAEVARCLALRLDAPLVMSVYSRLVADVNRRPDDPTCIPEDSDGTVVPGNRALSSADRASRIGALHEPYHAAIASRLAAFRPGVVPVVISIHSFTPMFKGVERPWHLGILWNRDDRLARPLMGRLRGMPGVVVGDNQPYSGQDRHGYTMPRHVEDVGIPHALIEIRQNLIDTRHGAEAWSDTLYQVLSPLTADPALRQLLPPS